MDRIRLELRRLVLATQVSQERGEAQLAAGSSGRTRPPVL